MKNKVLLISLIILSIILVGCQGNEFKRAERAYKKEIEKNPNRGAYEGLIQIYRENERMEDLASTVEEAIGQGYQPEEHKIYWQVLDYYRSLNNEEKIEDLMAGSFSNISLPISIYKEFILDPKLPKDMDLIEVKCGDISGDGKNELVALMAEPQEGINMNYYERVKLQVYDLRGQVIYEDGQEGGYYLYPKIALVDLNYDGIKDLYYNVIYDTITNAHTMAKVLSFKDKKPDLIYSKGIEALDIKIQINGDRTYRIYSTDMDQSYDIILEDNEKTLNPKDEIIWWEVYEKLTKDEGGNDIIQTNFEIKGYGMVQVNHSYIDGKIRPVDFKIEKNTSL